MPAPLATGRRKSRETRSVGKSRERSRRKRIGTKRDANRKIGGRDEADRESKKNWRDTGEHMGS